MPPRSQPKTFQVLVKTHKLTVFLALPNDTPISSVKEQVLSAFSDDVFKNVRGVPPIVNLGDFVLSREVKQKSSDSTSYEVLEDDQLLRDVTANWAILYIQFRDEYGEIQPVQVTIPSITEDDDDMPVSPSAGLDSGMDVDETPEESSVRKGKRKAVD
ncbi:hypothetical protein BC834DRAFT_676416 [Gloeopeniophorella convolvens]|nr:hypothetical protein BC834DRAFT_676416 [Gloeopeniophorella convolvens]